ncbi:MAG: fibrillarin-like rRNA/tRNA 2'-O-methyltransferase [Candidatus Aenigmarchaeota archaeon]|nr:fibrillarin-like rRNA/tRNA 2'-O-methyltransferase [Candidatus Aenigmarchaeota archaeon]
MAITGVSQFGKDYCTRNATPGKKYYDERIIRKGKDEFRVWDPTKSKLGAAIYKGLRNVPIFKGMKILYLGISTGTTSSHISDLIGNEGVIYGVEFSPRSVRDLVPMTKKRKNIVPILGDARTPEDWANRIEKVDMIYEDVAQPDQTDILIRNAKIFLKKGGSIMIAVKARSINVAVNPNEIFAAERKKIEKYFTITDAINLNPLEKDHIFFVGKLR